MATTVEQIKDRLSIVDLVSSYISLEKSGANFKARCPFHNERTPSFYVSPSRGSFYCFGCGAKGDIFSFTEAFEGLDFKGALRVLADRTGVEIVYEKKNTDELDEIYKVLEEATIYFEEELKKNPSANQYLKDRGVTAKTISDFRIGLALDEWRNLSDFLYKKGFKEVILEKAGLIKKSDENNSKSKVYDRFRNRIIFPITDSSGRTIAFSGRDLGKNENTPKYLNSPETQVFKKKNALFGIQFAKGEIRKRDYSILVEGQFDLVLLHQYGFTNAVASSGTAVTEGDGEGETLLKTLTRFSNNLMLCFDGDKAGMSASVRTAKIALKNGMDVKAVTLPDGVDPADALVKNPKILTDAIKNGKHIVDFLVDYLKSHVADERKLMRHIRESVLPVVLSIKSEVEKEGVLIDLAQKIGITKNAIFQDFELIEKKQRGVSSKESQTSQSAQDQKSKNDLLQRIFAIIFLLEEKNQDIDAVNAVKEKLKILLTEPLYTQFLLQYEKIKNELLLQAEITYSPHLLERSLYDLCLTLEEKILKKQKKEVLAVLKNLEITNSDRDEFLKKHDIISKRVEEIKISRYNQI